MATRPMRTCGSWMQKIDPIHGRSDFMVKLRGVNVWPEGVGTIVANQSGLTGEYYCIVERHGQPGGNDGAGGAHHRGQ